MTSIDPKRGVVTAGNLTLAFHLGPDEAEDAQGQHDTDPAGMAGTVRQCMALTRIPVACALAHSFVRCSPPISTLHCYSPYVQGQG